MRGLPALPKIERLEKPKRIQLEEPDGTYIGTWNYGITKKQAIEEAEALGYKIGRVILI